MKDSTSWNSVIAGTYSSPKIELVRGSGSRLYDSAGKSYLDFLSGIAVTALGHAHPAITEAILHQSAKLSHVSNLYANPVSAQLAQVLLEISGFENGKVFFCNSGAEANEAAIKYVRAFKPRSSMVSLTGGFHGRTMGALSITGQPEKRIPFEPLLGRVKFIDTNSKSQLKRKISKRTGGVWLELIQGEGGVKPLDSDFVLECVKISRDRNALVVVDEVQTGMGRTGKWFAFQNYEFVPDLMPLAKGLGGGLPIGALVISEKYADVIKPGGHGTTYGGNPIAAAAALAVIDTIRNENLLSNVIQQEEYIRDRMKQVSTVSEIRGAGLLLGFVLAHNQAKRVEELALFNGLLVNAVRPNVIRIAPPLNLSRNDASEAMDILTQCFDEVESHV